MQNSKVHRGDILLEGKEICKDFPGVWEHLVLDHVDISIKAGEIHTLLGENGAGKTVIANILSGFYGLSEGQIYVKGEPVYLKSPKDGIRYGVGMVHQELALVKPFTVAQNIALGSEDADISFPVPEIERRVREVSKKHNLYIDPKSRIEDLSAGEQQRAEIIKVLYHEPEVLILDEPTAFLDDIRRAELVQTLTYASPAKQMLIVTHDDDFKSVAQKIIRVQKDDATLVSNVSIGE